MIELSIVVALGLFGILVAIGISEIWYLLGITLVSESLPALYHPVRSSIYAYDIVGGDHVVAGLSLVSRSEEPGALLFFRKWY
jgi:hypothetical protein